MRCLGLDVGDKTIGVAISDPTGLIAQGVTTIIRKNKKEDYKQVLKFCEEYKVEKIICGMPKNMDGTIGIQGEKTNVFIKGLENRTRIPVVSWDERLTTKAANRALLEADFSRAKRKKVIDKVAAVYILQGFLDSVRLGGNNGR
ncbi:Holliday junction resolvase RuvX [Clostridium sp. DL1XJH146]